MEERWSEAHGYCMFLSRKGSDSASPAIPPKDAPATIGWLLQAAWDTRFVDDWLRANARSYLAVDDPSIDESVTDLEIFLRKLEGKL